MLLKSSITVGTSGTRAHLRILETTDLHLALMPWDYLAGRPAPGQGLAHVAAAVRALRAASRNTLLFDAGDFLQGSPLGDWVACESGFAPGDLHPAIAAMNALGYDGATLGNHDFGYGLPFLRAALARADFPVVSANLALQSPGGSEHPLVPPATVIERRLETGAGTAASIRIGLIGFLPPQVALWESLSLDEPLKTRDIVAAALAHLPALLGQRPDIVVALCHSGISSAVTGPGAENAATALAATAGIDVVLAGHTHDVFPHGRAEGAVDGIGGTLHGRPAVMAGSHGSHVGVVDLLLDREPSGRWRPAAHFAAALPVALAADQPPDPAVLCAVRPAHDRTLRCLGRRVGRTSRAISSRFAMVGGDPPSQLIAEALRAHARTLLADPGDRHLPILVAVAPYRAGGRGGPGNFVTIPAGPLTMRHMADLYGFPNGLVLLRADGRTARDWLETAASIFRRLQPGLPDQPLLDPAIPSYHFDSLHGARYRIDPAAPPGARIRDLRLADGTPLGAETPVLIATTGYRASGGGGYAMAAGAPRLAVDPTPIRLLLARHLGRDGDPAKTLPARPWDFVARPGMSAWFDTAPDAHLHLAEAAGLCLADRGRTSEGFRRLALAF